MAAANHYVDNKRLYEAMTEHVEAYKKAVEEGRETPPISNYIGRCVKLIAEKLSTSGKFINYSFREDMIGDGIETCLKYLHNFDPVKYNNPFAYFTQIIYYAFLHRIDKEKKQSYIKYKSLEQSIITNSLSDLAADDMEAFQNITSMFDADKYTALAERFEPKKVKKTKKDSPKGVETFIEDDKNE